MSTCSQILEFVFDSGRITSDPSDWEAYVAEVAVEVEFEARERSERGDFEGSIEECVDFAISHIS